MLSFYAVFHFHKESYASHLVTILPHQILWQTSCFFGARAYPEVQKKGACRLITKQRPEVKNHEAKVFVGMGLWLDGTEEVYLEL